MSYESKQAVLQLLPVATPPSEVAFTLLFIAAEMQAHRFTL